MVSSEFTRQQKDAEDRQKVADQRTLNRTQRSDRMELLLTQVASENPRERLLAVRFVEYLAHTNQFPEQWAPFLLTAVEDSNEHVAHTASHALTDAASLNSKLATFLVNAAKTNSDTKETLLKAMKMSPNMKKYVRLK